MIQYEIKITGKVQGVGFRFFVCEKAKGIGIKGWVKNTVDGGVLVMAQGDKTDLHTFIDYLHIGPTLSRVDRVLKHEMQINERFEKFELRV